MSPDWSTYCLSVVLILRAFPASRIACSFVEQAEIMLQILDGGVEKKFKSPCHLFFDILLQVPALNLLNYLAAEFYWLNDSKSSVVHDK